jgi:hypothetical protein
MSRIVTLRRSHRIELDHPQPRSGEFGPIETLANIKRNARFEPIELKDGPGWYVHVTLPRMKQHKLGNFLTELEAREWIKLRSLAWLKKYQRSRCR